MLMALATLVGAALWTVPGCGNETSGTETQPQACDTDLACLGGGYCCFADPSDATGICQPTACNGGTGGNTGTGGAPATGGGGSVGVGASPAIPEFTEVSGTASVDADGCLDATGVGAEPVHIAFSVPLNGATTIIVTGTMSPVPNGMGIDGVSIIQVEAGGVVNNMSVEQSHIARASYNILNGTGLTAIFDTLFNEINSGMWTPGTPPIDFVLTANVDTIAETAELIFAVDGTIVSTISAGNLGPVGGALLSLLYAQVRVCSVMVM
jgi:hypothetical protein